MAIYTLSNIPSMRAQRYLNISQRSLNTALERLSSGKKINHASDDPAGMLLSTRFTRSIQAWETGANNLQMATDLLNTADSFSTIIREDVERLNELANQSLNGLLSDNERALLDEEFQAILPEINRLATNTKYLGLTIFSGALSVEVKAGEGSTNVVTVSISGLSTTALQINGQSIGNQGAASTALSAIGAAFSVLAGALAEIGAKASAFTKSMDATDALVENLAASKATIMNADLAKETTNLTNSQIVVQSGISALVQANSAQTLALSLLGG